MRNISLIAFLILLEIQAFSGDELHFKNWVVAGDWDGSTVRKGAMDERGRIVLVTSGSQVVTSTSGGSWASQTLSPPASWSECTYLNGQFLIGGGYENNLGIGDNTTPPFTAFGWSTNGFDWNVQRLPQFAGIPENIVFGNGKYLAAMEGGYFHTSVDGRTWTSHTNEPPALLRSVGFGNGSFIFVSPGSQIYRSTDGLVWELVYTHEGGRAGGLCFGNGVFVVYSAYLDPNPILWSTDGINWEKMEDFAHYGDRRGFTKVIFGSGRFWGATYDGRFAHSLNGYQWAFIGEPLLQPVKPSGLSENLLVAGVGRVFTSGSRIFESPEFSTLLTGTTSDPLSIYGRPGSRHMVEYLSDTSEWIPHVTVEVGANGQTGVTNWLSVGTSTRIMRARALP